MSHDTKLMLFILFIFIAGIVLTRQSAYNEGYQAAKHKEGARQFKMGWEMHEFHLQCDSMYQADSLATN